MDTELVDIISPNGQVEKEALKTDAHAHGWLHKTIAGYLKSGDGWTFVRQSSDRQEPGLLVSAVGGHVRAGETVIAALRRESKEEIGASKITHKYLGKAIFHRVVNGKNENHLHHIYEISSTDKLVLGEESTAFEDLTTGDLRVALRDHPEWFGASLFFAFEHFYGDLLPNAYKNQWSRKLE